MSDLLHSLSEVVLRDETVTDVTVKIKECCMDLNTTYSKYIRILKQVTESAIMTGETHDALNTFIDVANNLFSKFDEVGDSAKVGGEVYLHDIDSADKYLY